MFKVIRFISATVSPEKRVYRHTDDATTATAAFTLNYSDIICPVVLCAPVCACVCVFIKSIRLN